MLREVIKKIPGARKLAHLLGVKPRTTGDRDFMLNMLGEHSIGAEIGVHLGDFSKRILDVVAPAELHLIDPWEHLQSEEYEDTWYGGEAEGGQSEMDKRHRSVCDRFAGEIDAGKVKVHRGYSTDVLEKFPDGYFDWIYIDGNHLYEFVMKDLELSFQKTKSGGFVTGDDYADGGWWAGGVKKAVNDFAKLDEAELITTKNEQFIFRNNS